MTPPQGPTPIHVAYVMYWGAVEPVGQATAVPTVLGLARSARVSLFSFEKAEDELDADMVSRQRRRMEEGGVRWIPTTYRPGYRGTPLDVLAGVRAVRTAHRREPIDVIEGRTFVGGLVGALCARLLDIPFVYHTEGCWLDEQVDVGRLDDASPLLRVLRAIDQWIADQAGALVAITDAGAERVRETLLRGRADVPVLIVPTTSVLVSTAPAVTASPVYGPDEPIHALYSGSVTGRYLLEELLLFVKEICGRRPGSRFELLAHRDRDVVEAGLARHGLTEVTTMGAVPHDRLSERIAKADVGFFLLEEGRSEPCVSPTKIPEYLAHGVAMICSRASGDGAGVIEGAGGGVIVENPADAAQRSRALDELDALLADPDRGRRAQAAARDFYSLERAVRAQSEVLARPAGPRRA